MSNEIALLKNNDKREWDDLEWVEEFYSFLQGEMPDKIQIARGHAPKMSAKKAMTIIWYLQEHFPILPSTIEKCSNCDGLFNTNSSGLYWESKHKHFCDGCSYLVPENYDRGKR